jgi:hypothetical protein
MPGAIWHHNSSSFSIYRAFFSTRTRVYLQHWIVISLKLDQCELLFSYFILASIVIYRRILLLLFF